MKNFLIFIVTLGFLFWGISFVKVYGLPSDNYLKSEKQAVGQMSTLKKSAPVSASKTSLYSMDWNTSPGGGAEGEGTPGDTGNQTAPVGDVTPAVVISLLLIYFVYRGVNISRRKNNL